MLKRKVLYSGKSPYGSYKVVDASYNGRPARVLYGDKQTPQSGMAKDDNPELLFSYNQRFFEMVMSVQPKKLLVIGGGAFMLPIAAFHRFADMTIDVVEIDPLLVQLSRDFFDLPDSERLRVHVEDGARFIKATTERYDMIIIDAFSGFTIPHHLLEKDTLLEYKKHMKKSGVIALNFISEYTPTRGEFAHETLASFGEVFSWRGLYQAEPGYDKGDEQNHVLVAGSRSVHFDYLQSTELEIFE